MERMTRTRRIGRGTGLVLAGAVGATALTGIAFAQDEVTDPSAGSTPAAEESETSGFPDRGLGVMGVPGTGPLLHGEQVVRNPAGQHVNIVVQNGTITAVSADSITVVSEDGFTATYAIDADTKTRLDRRSVQSDSLATDRPVRIIANDENKALLIGSTTADGQSAIEQRQGDREQTRQDIRERIRDFMDNRQQGDSA